MAPDGQESHRPAPDGPVSDGHPDLDTLADADAEVLDPPAIAEVLAHASGCATCGAALDALRAVRADLAAMPRPQLPAGVAARLDAVLDVERRARSGWQAPHHEHPPPPLGATPGSGDREPDPGRVLAFDPSAARPTRRVSTRRWVGWVAAAVILLGGGGVAALGVHRTNSPGDFSASGVGSGSSPTSAPGTDAAPNAVPGPGVLPQVTSTGTGAVPNYTRQDIEDNLAAILAHAGCDSGSCSSGLSGDMPENERTRCTSELNGQGVRGTPKVVQFVLFEGAPAFVFVFDDNRVVVVGQDCGNTANPTILFSDR